MLVEHFTDIYIIYDNALIHEVFFGSPEDVKQRVEFLTETYADKPQVHRFTYTKHRLLTPSRC